MINSVSSYENKKNPFGIVSGRNSAENYWLKESKKTDELTINDVITPEHAKKTNNIEAIGISIAIATLAVTGGLLLLLKGGPKGFNKAIENLKIKYTEKLQNAKLKGEQSAKYTQLILNKLNYLTQKREAINNFTTMKDYAFKRFMYVLGKPTRKIHELITNKFEKLGLRTVEHSYGEAASNLLTTAGVNSKLLHKIYAQNLEEQITIKGKTLTRKEWLNKLLAYTQDVNDSYNFHFGEARRKMRLDKMHKDAAELENDFNKRGDLWFLSKDIFKNFVAEQKMSANKMHIQTPIKNVKKWISYNKEDLCNETNEKITKLLSVVDFGEKDTIKAANILKKDLKEFAQADSKVTKEQLVEDIDKFLQEFSKGTSPDKKERLAAIGEFNDMKVSVINYCQGEVEEILDIYKGLLNPKDYNEIKTSYAKAVKSLNKSINLETEEFVNKLRDLTMGSAPTDILTNLVGVGTLAYYLAKSEDKQERMGIALKYGFPALTLIGVGLYGNAKLFAGSKSLIFGAVSSFIVNRIGSAANELLIRHFNKKKLQAEHKPTPELKQT